MPRADARVQKATGARSGTVWNILERESAPRSQATALACKMDSTHVCRGHWAQRHQGWIGPGGPGPGAHSDRCKGDFLLRSREAVERGTGAVCPGYPVRAPTRVHRVSAVGLPPAQRTPGTSIWLGGCGLEQAGPWGCASCGLGGPPGARAFRGSPDRVRLPAHRRTRTPRNLDARAGPVPAR